LLIFKQNQQFATDTLRRPVIGRWLARRAIKKAEDRAAIFMSARAKDQLHLAPNLDIAQKCAILDFFRNTPTVRGN
jgi:hypothetical protein